MCGCRPLIVLLCRVSRPVPADLSPGTGQTAVPNMWNTKLPVRSLFLWCYRNQLPRGPASITLSIIIKRNAISGIQAGMLLSRPMTFDGSLRLVQPKEAVEWRVDPSPTMPVVPVTGEFILATRICA